MWLYFGCVFCACFTLPSYSYLQHMIDKNKLSERNGGSFSYSFFRIIPQRAISLLLSPTPTASPMSKSEALSAARDSILADAADAPQLIRKFAIACGTNRPEASTVKAIRAVIERMADKFTRDKDAWEAQGASKTNFKQWKKRINDVLVDELGQEDLEDLSGVLMCMVAPSASPPPSQPPSAPVSSTISSGTPNSSETSSTREGRACFARVVHTSAADLNTSDITLISHTHGRQRRAERGIDRNNLQAAVKHGRAERANPGPHGEQRWRYTYQGVVYVTDETRRHEITSWREDGKDTPRERPETGAYGVHVVMVVDNSSSMNKQDVAGGATRKTAVFDSLICDLVEPQLTQGFLDPDGNAVASVISMSDEATVLMERVPFDSALCARLRKLGKPRAKSHGNYLPALAKAVELLERSRKDARLLMLFLSDGSPSDHVGMACQHGIHVWEPTGRKRHDGSNELVECLAGGGACRAAVQAKLREVCSKRVKHLGTIFGSDRVVFATVGFGPPKEEFTMLQHMADQLPKGSFHKAGLKAEGLKLAFSSLSSSLTTLRTESAGGKALTLRPISVRHEDSNEIRSTRFVTGPGWFTATSTVRKYAFSPSDGGFVPTDFEGDAVGIAFRVVPFAAGAERVAHRGSEITINPTSELCRVGNWLVTKQSRYEELLFDLDFHRTFCRLHSEAQLVAEAFNSRVVAAGVPSAAAMCVRFVQCAVYQLEHEGRTLRVLAEPELEGRYLKYNNNNGAVRMASDIAKGSSTVSSSADALGAIVEEDEVEEDEEDESEEEAVSKCNVAEVPQCFSHFSFVHSVYGSLVCDLQGVWNDNDGYTFTDPVMHSVSGEKHSNGATDKNAPGIAKFFDTHQCGPLCRLLSLPSPSEMTHQLNRRVAAKAQREAALREAAAREAAAEQAIRARMEAMQREARRREVAALQEQHIREQRERVGRMAREQAAREQRERVAQEQAASEQRERARIEEEERASKERLNGDVVAHGWHPGTTQYVFHEGRKFPFVVPHGVRDGSKIRFRRGTPHLLHDHVEYTGYAREYAPHQRSYDSHMTMGEIEGRRREQQEEMARLNAQREEEEASKCLVQ